MKVPPISSIAWRKRLGPERFGPGNRRASLGHRARLWCKACRTMWRRMMRKISLNRCRLALAFIIPPLENRTKEDRPAPRDHIVNGLLHLSSHLPANGFHHSTVFCRFRRILFYMNGWQDLRMPFRWQRHGQHGKSWRNRNKGPAGVSCPETRFDLSENGKYFRAPHGYKRNNGGAVPDGKLYKGITPKRLELIGVAITRECSVNSFRENP